MRKFGIMIERETNKQTNEQTQRLVIRLSKIVQF